jgi:hypothetical protein
MTETIAAPDLLTKAIDLARQRIAEIPPPGTKKRIHALWAACKLARVVDDSKRVSDAFMALAVEVNLIDQRGYWTGKDVRKSIRRHGREDAEHTITWALRGWNPFEKGPLK